MSGSITRIQLQNANELDYDKLDFERKKVCFQSDDQMTWFLQNIGTKGT